MQICKVFIYLFHNKGETMELTVTNIDNALKSDFWLQEHSTKALIVRDATRSGYIVRLSHTQAQWTEDGLLRARIELQDSNELDTLEKATVGDKAISIGCNSKCFDVMTLVKLSEVNGQKYIVSQGLKINVCDFDDCYKDTPTNRKAVRQYCVRRRKEWADAVIKQYASLKK